jgi:ureidoacrylate peracid hydrolase
MHKVDHEPVIQRLAAARGGKRHIFEKIDPSRTAHVVIDLQNGFMAPGAVVEVPVARDIVGNVNRIARALRGAGGLNVFIQFAAPDDLNTWSVLGARLGGNNAVHWTTFKPGTDAWKLWPELDVQPDDLTLDKYRFGALSPESSDLHRQLQSRNIDTLIVTGTLSNCCCETTVREAMQLNYKVLFVVDGNAARTDEDHLATLKAIGGMFADLYTADEVVELLPRVVNTG